MRLDKFLSETGKATRSESAKLAKMGKILVNGKAEKRVDIHIDPEKDQVTFCSQVVAYSKFTYIMLNKPEGYVSATDDPREKTVLDLLPDELKRLNLFPCGRLDKSTLGLVMLTNDGEGAHRLLSPKHHVPKTYKFECKEPLSNEDISELEKGVDIGGYFTKPCVLKAENGAKSGEITLTEGKYHQIKRMFEAMENKITYLERITFGTLVLDKNLKRGEWRYLTNEETISLFGGKE
jgi:16S rRNA pseudouridine516 synthase